MSTPPDIKNNERQTNFATIIPLQNEKPKPQNESEESKLKLDDQQKPVGQNADSLIEHQREMNKLRKREQTDHTNTKYMYI